ncbi:MAG: hypothetical protein AB1427_14105 [Thermodesulfobacteriota bacterium]
MNHFSETQDKLDRLIPIPADLPRLYLFGDTGTGKTSLVRQILGTRSLNFPSVRRKRTTVVPTEYLITSDGGFKAAVLLKSNEEVQKTIAEILEDALFNAFKAQLAGHLDIDQVIENIGESPDQRFRLRYILPSDSQRTYADMIVHDFLPIIVDWIQNNFPDEQDVDGVFELAVGETLAEKLNSLQTEILSFINGRVREKTGKDLADGTVVIEHKTLQDFIDMLKPLLAAEPNSLSPVVRYSRIQGPFRSNWLADEAIDLVLTDGEGIGHDTREDKMLSSRHLDYFYRSDLIVLVEDSERPFTGAGKAAIAGVVRNGYLPRFHLCFCRLDLVEGEDRRTQISDVNAGLRNVLNSLSDENVTMNRNDLSISYVSHLDKASPDDESVKTIVQLLRTVRDSTRKAKGVFVRPQYDFELIAAFLDHATQAFRKLWNDYLFGHGGPKQPWQTVKAFNRRMVWREDGYKSLQPISELHGEIMKRLSPYFASVKKWDKVVTVRLQQSSVDSLRQEFAQLLKEMIRETLIAAKYGNWENALELSGRGSTFDRAHRIGRIITEVAPPLTASDAAWIKDKIKHLVGESIEICLQKAE